MNKADVITPKEQNFNIFLIAQVSVKSFYLLGAIVVAFFCLLDVMNIHVNENCTKIYLIQQRL